MKIYDSDSEELEEKKLAKSLTFFSRKRKVPAVLTTIICSDKNIKGDTLIKKVHECVERWKNEAIDYACEPERDQGYGAMIPAPTVENLTLYLREPREWFMTLGGWKGMIPSEEQRHYFFFEFFSDPSMKSKKFCSVSIFGNQVKFILKDHRIHMPAKFSIGDFDVTQSWEKNAKQEWKKITKTDLSYNQILAAISYIKKTYEVKDSEIAKLQLCNVNCSTTSPKWLSRLGREDIGSISTFLDYLNALMFGVEASGLNAALLTSAMTLDLIVDGVYSYEDTFKANEDGGIYPYACFGDNKGSYKAREEAVKYKGCSCVLMLESGTKPSVDKDIISLIPDAKGNMQAYWYENDTLKPHPIAPKNMPTLKEIFEFTNEISINHSRFMRVTSLCGYVPPKPSMRIFRDTPSLSPVAVKEAIIIKQWLQQSGVLNPTLTYKEQIKKIDAAINDLAVFCFSPSMRHCYSIEKFRKHPHTNHTDEDIMEIIRKSISSIK